MRKVSVSQSLVFALLISVAVAMAWGTTWLLLGRLPLGDFRGIVLASAGAVLFFAYSVLVYRLFLWAFPLLPGEIPEGSQQEFVYHIYVLFYLFVFYSLMRTGFTPAPIMRLVYLALGARLGSNTYSQGIILDPPFVQIGHDSVVGQYALIVPHVIEGRRLAHYPVRIGNHVTIGAHAVILSGVEVGDGALVATGAIVTKGTRIGAGEVWAGVPARRVDPAQPTDAGCGPTSDPANR